MIAYGDEMKSVEGILLLEQSHTVTFLACSKESICIRQVKDTAKNDTKYGLSSEGRHGIRYLQGNPGYGTWTLALFNADEMTASASRLLTALPDVGGVPARCDC